jgi:transposase
MHRNPYPSDVRDDEWAFVAPYLTLMPEEAPPRDPPLREVVTGLRWIARTGAPWRMLPNDLPPWSTVYQQTHRWVRAGVVEAIVHALRTLLREIADRAPHPRAAIFDRRTLQSSPERGARAGYAGAKRRRGRKVPIAVATLGHLLAVVVTPANEQDRAQVADWAQQVQEAPGELVQSAGVDQGYTGEQAAAAATAQGIRLEVVKLPDATRGVVVLPRRWVVARSCAWMARFRRLARDYERLPETVAGLHFLACALVMLKRFITFMVERT